MARLSEYSKGKKVGKKGGNSFCPPIKEWREACELYYQDNQIFRHFCICKETFYSFIDKERYKEEQGNYSAYLDAYKSGRNKSTKEALDNLRNLSRSGDTATTIFRAKTFGGLIEAKDIKHIELKKYEVAFKTKQFLTQLAEKFELNKEELEKFTEKYFKDVKLDEI